jgi:NADH:ubiquinone oxidoreductase subunit F (NADH-binding)
MNVENLMNSMTIEYKLEILARFFYYIEQNKNIPFNEINSDEQDLCYFVANRYILENEADELIEALIIENDNDYIRATDDYIIMRNKECPQQIEKEDV